MCLQIVINTWIQKNLNHRSCIVQIKPSQLNSNCDEIHYCADVLSHFASTEQEFLEILIFSSVLLPEHI